MFELLYTGAGAFAASQNSPAQSLGGYVSNTLIPNGLKESFFPDIQIVGLKKDLREIIGICLHYTGSVPVNGVAIKAWINHEAFEIKAAAVAAQTDSCQGKYIQSLGSSQELPIGIQFSAITQSIPLSLGTLQPNQYVGIWLLRQLSSDPTKTNLILNSLTCDALQDSNSLFENDLQFNLNIDWN